MTTELATIQTSGEIISTQELRAGLQAAKEQQTILGMFVRDVMTEDVDYGTIPGTDKIVNGQKVPNRTLLKPGAEKLVALFKCSPKFHIRRREDPSIGLYAYEFRCEIYSSSGALVAEGFGSASSMESKHRWRTAQRTCPKCQAAAIQVSKFADKNGGEFGIGSYYCFAKVGGCGAKFKVGDQAIEGQKLGRTENPDMADVANSVLKMAKKRAMVDAALALSRCSDLFGQDLEDFRDVPPPKTVEAPKPETPQELQARVSAMVKANHEAVMGKPPPPVPTAESSSGRTVAFEADNAGSNPASATLTPGSSSGRNAGSEPVNGGSNPSPGTNPFQSDPEFAPADRATTLHRDQLMNFKFASGPRKGQFVSSAALTDLLQMRDYFRAMESKKPEPDSKSLGNKQLLEALTFHADLKEAAKHEAEMGALAHQTSEEAAQ